MTHHIRKGSGVTDNLNCGSVLFKCPRKKSWQWASTHDTKIQKLKRLNGLHLSFISLFTPVLFLLWHVQMSMKKIQSIYLTPILFFICFSLIWSKMAPNSFQWKLLTGRRGWISFLGALAFGPIEHPHLTLLLAELADFLLAPHIHE